MLNNKSHTFFVVSLLFVLVAMLLLVNPSGNFPLNDDWVYARPVDILINQHIFKIPDQHSPIMVSQVFWGALFCLPFGFSFMALRVSVIVLGFISMVFFYFLIHRLTANKVLSFICTLLILCNPLYLCLTTSFMTDIPFMAFSIISIYFFLCAMETSDWKLWSIAVVVSICATLTRQFGIVIPIAFAIVGIFNKKAGLTKWMMHLLPSIIVALVLLATLHILHNSHSQPAYGKDISALFTVDHFWGQVTKRCGAILDYSGFFLVPVFFLVKNPFRGTTSIQRWIAIVVVLLFTFPIVFEWYGLPVANVLNIVDVGANTIRGFNENMPDGIHKALDICKRVSFAGGIILLAYIGIFVAKLIRPVKGYEIDNTLKQKAFVFFCIIGYSVLTFISRDFFDRYILYLFPLLLIIIVPVKNEAGVRKNLLVHIISGSMIVILAVYSSLATHDYFAWNQARWSAIHYLKDQCGISPNKIDGGYEFNGLYIAPTFIDRPNPMNKRSWWFVDDDEYIISFSGQDGYTIIKQVPYQNYLPHETREINVLQRK